MREELFRARLGTAEPGHVIEYFRGFLFDSERTSAKRIASIVRGYAEAGRVFLTQHRYGPFDYGYLATVAEPGDLGNNWWKKKVQ